MSSEGLFLIDGCLYMECLVVEGNILLWASF